MRPAYSPPPELHALADASANSSAAVVNVTVNPLVAAASGEDNTTVNPVAAAASGGDGGGGELPSPSTPTAAVKPASCSAAVVPVEEKSDDGPDEGTSLLPGWCVGNTVLGLFLLCVAFLVEAVLFAFHCTSILDVMIDEPDARGWVGVTPTVAVVAGILLIPAMLETAVSIGQLTCCRRCTMRRALRHNAARVVLRSNSSLMMVFNFFLYIVSPATAHFFTAMLVLEAKEFVFQALALEQMSRAGIGREALTLFTTVILINGLAPLGMRWIVNRINRIDDPIRRRIEASKWISRLLLFDATCDLLYSFFALGHLLVRYFRIFGKTEADAAELEVLNRFKRSTGDYTTDLEAYMLLSEGRATLFGGANLGDVFIKLVARVVPLLQAPFRVMSAFAVRQSVSAGKGPTSSMQDIAGGNDHSDTAVEGSSPSILRRQMTSLVRRSAFAGRYSSVPRWAAGSLFVVAVTFCTIVYARLWSWGECPVPEIRRSCAVRAFPIFHTYDDAEDFGCRSCACNTLFYVDDNCTAAGNSSAPSGGCHAPTTDSNGRHLDRYASTVLNVSASILQPATTIMVQACASDTNLLRTLGMRAFAPTVIWLSVDPERAATSVGGGNSSSTAAASFTWAFPPGFGHSRGSTGDGDLGEVFPLVVLGITGPRVKGWLPSYDLLRNDTVVRLANLPASLGRMSTLKELRLEQGGLTQVPPFASQLTALQHLNLANNIISTVPSYIAQQLTALQILVFSNNQIDQIPVSLERLTELKKLRLNGNLLRSVPSSIGQRLTRLRELHLQNNYITSVPASIGRLTRLRQLDFSNNEISSVPAAIGQPPDLHSLRLGDNQLTFVPSSIGQLTGLNLLQLQQNHLTSLPSFIGRLVSLKRLDLTGNLLITSIPASIARLTKLKYLSLGGNGLTTIPISMLTAPRSSSSPNLRLNLETNNISFAAMEAVLAAISTPSSPPPGSSIDPPPPSSLMLLGRNPACSSNRSLASRVGPWKIKCEAECALHCHETGIGELKSSLGNKDCDRGCYAAACGWDGGDC